MENREIVSKEELSKLNKNELIEMVLSLHKDLLKVNTRRVSSKSIYYTQFFCVPDSAMEAPLTSAMEAPLNGTSSTYNQIALRGPNGERIAKDEALQDFLNRINNALVVLYDKSMIQKIVHYVNKTKDVYMVNDKENQVVTFWDSEQSFNNKDNKNLIVELVKKESLEEIVA